MFPAEVVEFGMLKLPLFKVTVLPLWVKSELLTVACAPLLVNTGIDPLLHELPQEICPSATTLMPKHTSNNRLQKLDTARRDWYVFFAEADTVATADRSPPDRHSCFFIHPPRPAVETSGYFCRRRPPGIDCKAPALRLFQ